MTQRKTGSEPRIYVYEEVLGLPNGAERPDHYALLGLPPFERDHGSIVRASRERLQLLNTCAADDSTEVAEVVDAVHAHVLDAQMTLCHEERRNDYEQAFAKESGLPLPEGFLREDEQGNGEDVDLAPGTLFAGRYRILRKLRPGALGTVYQAMDARLRYRVFLSVLRIGLSSERKKRRPIENAARAVAVLDHPHILRFDEVDDDDGLLYVRARFVEGATLLEHIEAAPGMQLDIPEVLRRSTEIARALVYAHGKGVPHGDLKPANIMIDPWDRLLVTDCAISRAVSDQLGEPGPWLYRAPEADNGEDRTPAGDLFSFGCVIYQMLTGTPPFAAKRRAAHPLPEQVPVDLRKLVERLMAPYAADRPETAEKVLEEFEALAARARRAAEGTLPAPKLAGWRSVAGWAAAAAFALLSLVLLLSGPSGGGDAPDVSLSLAEGRLVDALRDLRAHHAAHGDERSAALLAATLRGAAGQSEARGDPWEAQILMEEALRVREHEEHRVYLQQVRSAAAEKLQQVEVHVAPVSSAPVLTVAPTDVPLSKVRVDDVAVEVQSNRAEIQLDLPDGDYARVVRLRDVAGNEVGITVRFSVDATPPKLEMLEPAKDGDGVGESFRVRVRVTDAHPPTEIEIQGRKVPVQDGVATTTCTLADGRHTLLVSAPDGAGNYALLQRDVVVVSGAPVLELEAPALYTRDGKTVVRGTVEPPGTTVRVGDTPVVPRADGTFEHAVQVSADSTLLVEAQNLAGVKVSAQVTIGIDKDAPKVELVWKRTDDGRLLYGATELDQKQLQIPLRVQDRSPVTIVASEGEVSGSVWTLPAKEGSRKIRLQARDAAGNLTYLDVELEGRRAAPYLSVVTTWESPVKQGKVVLDVESDAELSVQGKTHERSPGSRSIPVSLPEGAHDLIVRAMDRYGNEATWRKHVVVDLTPPTLQIAAGKERRVGRQRIDFTADEPLASLKVGGRVYHPEGKSLSVEIDIRDGRRNLFVTAADLAGNVSQQTFELTAKNKVLVLNGSSAVRVDLKDTFKQFTLECWARGPDPEGVRVLLSMVEGGSFGIYWSEKGSSLPRGLVGVKGAGYVRAHAKAPWKWKNWTHLALVFDGEHVRFFVNGKLQSEEKLEGERSISRRPLYVGADPDNRSRPGYFFTGAVDEVRVSNVARYTKNFKPAKYFMRDKQTELLLHFDLDLASHFEDDSGHKRHGKPAGAPELAVESR